MKRKLTSWTQGFEEYVRPMGSPLLFGRWTGIFTLAAAMERKTFVDTPKGRLFPNLYTILVGPAGAGKTVATSVAYEMMLHLEEHHIAPTSITKASMMDGLEKALRHVVRPQDTPAVIDFNSLTIMSNELGVLIPAYDNEFINVLTDIYDCKRYSESRRTTKREFDIRAPQFNILAATTPSYLNNLMPEGAWDQGFISRTMLIYSGRGESVDLFEEAPLNKALYADLLSDLRQIGNDLYGRFKFTEEAIAAFRAWMKDKEEPVPDHPKLQHYNSRRVSHLLKLCMVASASTSNDLIVTLENYAEAFDWLIEVEAAMPDIFRSMVSGGASRVIDETWHFAYDRSRKKKGEPVPEQLLVAFIAERAPAHEVMRVLDIMQKNGVFKSIYVQGVGTCYEVRPRPTRLG